MFSSANSLNLGSGLEGDANTAPMTALYMAGPSGGDVSGSGAILVSGLSNTTANFRLIYKAGWKACRWRFSQMIVMP